ncbi:unnamed protein product [Didymodactylos carnosus]|uniref:COP9 signalosome complex subunit 3 n=1 Tax=Didymodactylos carnosus TaxID=1234261 RepID=A0A813ZE12_9BILA|nr:unnamed protein product [Didymodactylos carnosus]CAF1059692.1 unnamed protein product [Didymodactylos carnosus]CAF3681015.1 unnamed protein product [Didymodactylos carnosus]CAF3825308.1 unnamed protein product [Didymodactylos carnosus]
MSALDQYVDHIRRLSGDKKYSELAQSLLISNIFHKNIQHIENILTTFALPEHTLCALGALHTIARGPNIPDFDRYLTQMEIFTQTCSAEQIQYLPHFICDICHVITERLRQNRTRSGIAFLFRTIELVRHEPGQLLSIHSDLYQLCLLAQWFEPALHYLDTDIIEINRENGRFDVKYLLLYYYYGGMIYTCVKQYDRALNFFENVLTVPANVTSLIMIEAYKKYTLVKLIVATSLSTTTTNTTSSSSLSGLPSYISRSSVQAMKSLCTTYTELANLFSNNDLQHYQEFIHRHQEQFQKDKNLGLVKQTLNSFICHSIQQLTKTFLTVSLNDLAQRVKLKSSQEAEKYLLDMIENGQIFASLNKKDGMVIFHGCPENFDSNAMILKLQEETEKCMIAEKQLRELEKNLALSKTYIQRVLSMTHDRSKMLL